MNPRSIANQQIVDLKNCESEPIHIPGSIQPHGFLLGLQGLDLTILFCSENTFNLIGLRYDEILGKGLDFLLTTSEAREIQKQVSEETYLSAAPPHVKIADKIFTCSISRSGDTFLLEFEPLTQARLDVSNVYQQTKLFTSYMQEARTLAALCQLVADETRRLTGFDRVMIYQFDEMYNGRVIAESKVAEVESFLDLHYPHTDIPAQARALYLNNLLRLIVDVNYNPAPIFTTAENPDQNLDLSLAVLRSVSPIHIQYLKNMGVGSSMSISLIHQEKLWGLIACHHYSPKFVPNDIRIAAQLQGHFLTSQIPLRESAEEYQMIKQLDYSLNRLLDLVFSADSISLEQLVQQPEMLSLNNSSCVIMMIDQQIFMAGEAPSQSEIRKLINWLHTYSLLSGFTTSNIASLYPDAKAWCHQLSGVAFYPLGSTAGDCIIWGRVEQIQEIKWAGNPNEAMLKTEASALTPRKSFETYRQVKTCESHRWQKAELSATLSFVNAFQKYVYLSFLKKEEAKQRRLNEKLKEANAELENLYWIGSHDLKEPLRKIQMSASRIVDQGESPKNLELIMDSVKRMNNSAKRMQGLISDIISYSRIRSSTEDLEPVDLNELLTTIVDEMQIEINEKSALIRISELPVVKGINSFLQQLFINLIRNSLKFSKANRPPQVDISYTGISGFPQAHAAEERFYHIVVKDNGIGFENEYSESIFKVFSRLHTQNEYSGSGVGLALSKRIMSTHGGYITAKGIPDIGAEMHLYFPVESESGEG